MATAIQPGDFPTAMASLAGTVRESTPMLWVADMRAAVGWYWQPAWLGPAATSGGRN